MPGRQDFGRPAQGYPSASGRRNVRDRTAPGGMLLAPERGDGQIFSNGISAAATWQLGSRRRSLVRFAGLYGKIAIMVDRTGRDRHHRRAVRRRSRRRQFASVGKEQNHGRLCAAFQAWSGGGAGGEMTAGRDTQNRSCAIRPAVPADLAAVEAIVRDAYGRYISRIGREPGPMLDDYASLIGDGYVHVAVRDAVVRGVLVLVPQVDAMLLDNVAVARAAQGTGVGRSLLEFAERSAMAAGFGKIKLYTNEVMTENIALYDRIGYVETHRAEEKGLRRVYMVKSLSGN